MVELDGNPWFVAADVCRSLGLKANPSNGSFNNHYGRLAADEKTLYGPTGFSSRLMLLSESGLYKLIMRSDKPQAREFQDWVTREVLPAIRKDGMYLAGEEKVRTGEMSEDEGCLYQIKGIITCDTVDGTQHLYARPIGEFGAGMSTIAESAAPPLPDYDHSYAIDRLVTGNSRTPPKTYRLHRLCASHAAMETMHP